MGKRAKRFGREWKVSITSVIIGALLGAIIPLLFYLDERQRYRDQSVPELDTTYKYHAESNSHSFYILNIGLIDCADIWASETIFVLIDGIAYEGTDIPHFNYIVYNGSHQRMWALAKNDTVEVSLPELQMLAFSQIIERFGATIIPRWTIAFSAPARDKRYIHQDFYVYDREDGVFRRPEDVVGGASYLEAVQAYIAAGPMRAIGLFLLTGQYEIDPPPAFLINPDYSFEPVYPSTRLTVHDFNRSLLFVPEQPELQADSDYPAEGSLRYTWQFADGMWEKTWEISGNLELYTKWTTTPSYYLSDEERRLVMADTTLLKHDLTIGIGSFPDDDPILTKARAKYMGHRLE